MLNEPSVGLYRVQEHIRRSLPQLVDKKVSMLNAVLPQLFILKTAFTVSVHHITDTHAINQFFSITMQSVFI